MADFQDDQRDRRGRSFAKQRRDWHAEHQVSGHYSGRKRHPKFTSNKPSRHYR
jgi:hypothetical protein